MTPDTIPPGSRQRRYPRLETNELEVGVRKRVAPKTAKQRVEHMTLPLIPAQICNASPEGACIEAESPLDVSRRDWIVVRLKIEDDVIELPARVAWTETVGGVQRIGMKLKLELAAAGARTRYARWVVNAIQASRNPDFF